MTNTTYELRTVRDTPVYSFDNETRAREEMRKATKRIGTKLRLIKITRVEEELA